MSPHPNRMKVPGKRRHIMRNDSHESSTSNNESNHLISDNNKQTVCSVCDDMTDNHHSHYGAMVCLSCRAFFRRAHSNNDAKSYEKPNANSISTNVGFSLKLTKPNYVCKKNNECIITIKTRKKCQKCRYEKCLKAGMDPNQVLNKEQKQVRFRKVLEQRGTMSFTRKKSGNKKNSTNVIPIQNPSESDELAISSDEGKPESDDHHSNVIKSNSTRTRCYSDASPKKQVFTNTLYSQSSENRKRCQSGDNVGNKLCSGQFTSPKFPSTNPSGLLGRSVVQSDYSSDLSTPSSSSSQIPMDSLFSNESRMPTLGSGWSPAMAWNPENFLMNFDQTHNPNHFFNDVLEFETQKKSITQSQHVMNQCISVGSVPSSDSISISPPTTCNTPMNNVQLVSTNTAPNILSSIGNTNNSTHMEKLQNIYQAYEISIQNTEKDLELEQRFVYLYKNNQLSSLGESDFQKVVAYRVKQFHLFAKNLYQFSSLPESDQRILLSTNSRLYIIFIFAKYNLLPNGQSQLNWILPGIAQDSNLEKFEMESFIRSSGFFKSSVEEDVIRYINCVNNLNQLNLVQQHTPFMAAILIFNQIDEITVKRLTKFWEISNASKEVFDALEDPNFRSLDITRSKIEKAIDILNLMSASYIPDLEISNELFDIDNSSSNALCANSDLASILNNTEGLDEFKVDFKDLNAINLFFNGINELEMGITNEEDKWFDYRLEKVHEAYKNISLGYDLMMEFIMFTYDVPLSKKFIPSELKTFIERSRRMLLTHSQFADLKTEDLNSIWNEGRYLAAAICSVKSESHKTGKEQIKFCLGKDDEENFQDKCSNLSNTGIKKVLLTDWNKTANVMNSQMVTDYSILTSQVTLSVEEDLESFILVLLLSLLSVRSARKIKNISALEKQYWAVLNNRVKKSQNERFYSKFTTGLKAVNELGELFEKLCSI